MSLPLPHARLEIISTNLKHNLDFIKSKLNDDTKVLVLVKANAYGHGAIPVSNILEKAGVDYLAVATVGEGVALRENGITVPIMILTMGLDYNNILIENNLEPVLYDFEVLERFADTLDRENISSYPVHINFDTGMHRLGYMEKDMSRLKDFISTHPRLFVKSIYSHLAVADELDQDEFTKKQIAQFNVMADEFTSILPYKPLRHILNTAGIERFPEYQYDMVRLGIGAYGISPLPTKEEGYEVCGRLKCPIIQVRNLEVSDGTIGYGRKGIITDKVKTIATIPVGYADGIDKRLGCGAVSFEVNGQMAPTIGNICMDMCMLDVTGIPVKFGDIVTIFGENPRASTLSNAIGTIPYEIICSISERIERVVVNK